MANGKAPEPQLPPLYEPPSPTGPNPLDLLGAVTLASSNPDAMAMVVEEYRQQKRERVAQEAERKRVLAENAFRARQESFQTQQLATEQEFTAGESSKTREQQKTLADREFGFSQEQFGFQKKQASEELAIKKRGLALQEAATAEEIRARRTDTMLKIAGELGDLAGTLSKGSGTGLSTPDLLKLPDGAMLPPDALMGENAAEIFKKLAPIYQANAAARQSALGNLAAATGQAPAELGKIVATQMAVIMSTIPEDMRATVAANMAVGDPTPDHTVISKVAEDKPLSPEETLALTNSLATTTVEMLSEGSGLSRPETAALAKLWNSYDTPEKKNLLEKTLYTQVQRLAMKRGWDDEKANAFAETAAAALVMAAESGDRGAYRDLVIDTNPDPIARERYRYIGLLTDKLERTQSPAEQAAIQGEIEKVRSGEKLAFAPKVYTTLAKGRKAFGRTEEEAAAGLERAFPQSAPTEKRGLLEKVYKPGEKEAKAKKIKETRAAFRRKVLGD